MRSPAWWSYQSANRQEVFTHEHQYTLCNANSQDADWPIAVVKTPFCRASMAGVGRASLQQALLYRQAEVPGLLQKRGVDLCGASDRCPKKGGKQGVVAQDDSYDDQ